MRLSIKRFFFSILFFGFLLVIASIVWYTLELRSTIFIHYKKDITENIGEIQLFLDNAFIPQKSINTFLVRRLNSSDDIEAIYITDKNGHILYRTYGSFKKYAKLPVLSVHELSKDIFLQSPKIHVKMAITLFDQSAQRQKNYWLHLIIDTSRLHSIVDRVTKEYVVYLVVLIFLIFLFFIAAIFFMYNRVARLYNWTKRPETMIDLSFKELNDIESNILSYKQTTEHLTQNLQRALRKEQYLRRLMELAAKINEEMIVHENFREFLLLAIQHFKSYQDFRQVCIKIGDFTVGDMEIFEDRNTLVIDIEAQKRRFGKLCIKKDGRFLEEEVAILQELAGDIGFAYYTNLQKEQKERSLYYNAVTGLPTLSYFQAHQESFVFDYYIVVDILDFKRYNTYFGLKFTNKILQAFAQELQQLSSNRVFHIVIDQFFIPFEGKLDQARAFCHGLVAHFEKQDIEVEDIDVDISIRCAIVQKDEQNALQKAVLAVKKADRHNPVVVYEKGSKEQENLEFKRTYLKIKKLIEEKRVVAYKQAVVDNKTLRPAYYEILARIHDSENILTPYHFMDIVKRSRLYYRLVEQIYKQVFGYLAAHTNPDHLSINLSFGDIESEQMREYLLHNIRPLANYITIEVLETESMEHEAQIRQFLQRLKSYGSRVAIDDFGSGYANFDYVLKLGADYIKIDGSLIKNIEHPISYKIVKHISLLAKDLGLKTVAEFVENEQIFQKVKELGIDYSQGYYFHKPEPLNS